MVTFELLLSGVLGVLFHCLLKLRSLQHDARVGNVPFSAWKDYWTKDVVSISLSFLSVFIWLLIFGEVGNKYKGLLEFKMTSFALMGMMGSYVLQLVLGTAKKRICNIVNTKTDIADGKHPGGL